MQPKASETNSNFINADARVAAWWLGVSLLGRSAEMQSRLVAFSPAELKEQFENAMGMPAQELPREALAALHRAQARFDGRRVHASWVKALEQKQITPVRRAIRRSADGNSASLTRMMHEVASGLYAERLVGDAVPAGHDAAVVRLFSGERPMRWLRRLAWAGRLRRWVAGEANCISGLAEFAECQLPKEWPELAKRGMDQLTQANKGKPWRRSKLAIVTLGSLAGQVDSRRRQWLLQHLPMSAGALMSPFLRVGKPALNENEMEFETWLAEAAITIEEQGLQAFQSRIRPVKEEMPAKAGPDENAIRAEATANIYETSDMDLFLPGDDSSEYSLLRTLPAEVTELTNSLELDDSGEMAALRQDHSGLFSTDADDFVIEESGEIEIQDFTIEDEDDEEPEFDNSDSSFRIGDLEL